MESHRCTLPKLIFLEENHLSPLVANLLTEWTPKLTNKGYKVFYAEVSPRYTLSEMIDLNKKQLNEFKESEPLYEAFYKLIDQWFEEKQTLNLPDYIWNKIDKSNIPFYNMAKSILGSMLPYIHDLYRQFHECKKNISSETQLHSLINDLVASICSIANGSKSSLYNCQTLYQAKLQFHQTLEINQIQFEGIDVEGIDAQLEEMNKKMLAFDSLEEGLQKIQEEYLGLTKSILSNIDSRDLKMVESWLKPDLAFGIIGALHLEGLQKLVLERMGIEEANSTFTFIYPFEGLPTNEITKKIREELINFPIKVIMLDLTDKSRVNLNDILDQITLNSQKIQVPGLFQFGQFLPNLKDKFQGLEEKSSANTLN